MANFDPHRIEIHEPTATNSAQLITSARGPSSFFLQNAWPSEDRSAMVQSKASRAGTPQCNRTPTPNLVQIHPLEASGQMGEIPTFRALFIYLFIPFFRLAYRSDWWVDFYAR